MWQAAVLWTSPLHCGGEVGLAAFSCLRIARVMRLLRLAIQPAGSLWNRLDVRNSDLKAGKRFFSSIFSLSHFSTSCACKFFILHPQHSQLQNSQYGRRRRAFTNVPSS
jgi:hypothetical protein